MITVFQKIKTPPLWAKCLIVSMTIHSVALYFLIENPILLNKSWTSFFSPSQPIPKYISIDKNWKSNDLTIEHFFEEFPSSSKKIENFSHSSFLVSEFPLEEPREDIVINLASSFFLKENSLIQNRAEISNDSLVELENEEITLTSQSFPLPPLSRPLYAPPTLHGIYLDLKTTIPALEINTIPIQNTTQPLKELVPGQEPLAYSDKTALDDSSAFVSFQPRDPFSKPQEEFSASLKNPKISYLALKSPLQVFSPASLSEINDFLPEDLISSIEWNNDFDIRATLFPEQDGYVFSLAVTPKEDLSQQKIKQNFYFLIDTSSEIENHKLSVFKKSVLKALSVLQQGDSFNIFLIDKKTTKLSPINLFISSKNILLAESFLEKKGERALFSSLNLKKNLDDLLADIKTEDEVHTAIFLSNGKSTLNPQDLSLFLKKNHGKLNIFTAAVGQNNQLTFLDMISSFCGGTLFYSDTNASFPRKLSLFIKNLNAPLAKNLTISILPSHPTSGLEFDSSSAQMGNLYNKEPFFVMGKINRLCDLDFILQGKSSDDQIFLKKIIHFEEAMIPGSSIKKQWLLHQKGSLYEKFLKEAKPIYLKKAKDILKTVYGRAVGE